MNTTQSTVSSLSTQPTEIPLYSDEDEIENTMEGLLIVSLVMYP